jgi:hypothetical protein
MMARARALVIVSRCRRAAVAPISDFGFSPSTNTRPIRRARHWQVGNDQAGVVLFAISKCAPPAIRASRIGDVAAERAAGAMGLMTDYWQWQQIARPA